MSGFSGNPMVGQENPIITALEGELFVPQDKEWKSENKKWIWIGIDVAIVAGFILLAIFLAI